MTTSEEIKTPLQQRLDEFAEQLSMEITLNCIAPWAKDFTIEFSKDRKSMTAACDSPFYPGN